jgi:hypothetical protein
MPQTVTEVVSHSLPVPMGGAELTDLAELRDELEVVAAEAELARAEGLSWDRAVDDPRLPGLRRMHHDLRDAMFVELPEPVRGWVQAQASGELPTLSFADQLARLATQHEPEQPADLQVALAEFLVFESVRLRLLVAAWHSGDFERLGGEEDDIDQIAAEEVDALLGTAALADDHVRPMHLLFASAHVSLARDAAERADGLARCGDDTRERLEMRARLREALRELRLPESVLLTNALSTLLEQPRRELTDLQSDHALALSGMSRQAMDQRVSRGRRALTQGPSAWPRRRGAALYDLLRPATDG